MIFGIGVDVLEAQRVTATYARFGAHFVARLLMPEERVQFQRSQRPARFLGMRFAAKEAIVKAMGTGFAHGMWLRDVGVVQNSWGRPEIVYSPRGERVRRRLGIGDGHVTLTDEAGLVVAVAVLLRASGRARAGKARQAASAAKAAPAAKAVKRRKPAPNGRRPAGAARTRPAARRRGASRRGSR